MPHFSNPLNNHRDASSYVTAPDRDGTYKRAALGLPEASDKEGAPLLACFNSGYKHSVEAFDMWAEVSSWMGRIGLQYSLCCHDMLLSRDAQVLLTLATKKDTLIRAMADPAGRACCDALVACVARHRAASASRGPGARSGRRAGGLHADAACRDSHPLEGARRFGDTEITYDVCRDGIAEGSAIRAEKRNIRILEAMTSEPCGLVLYQRSS